MPEYRRWRQPGGTFFFTVVTYQRHPLFRNSHAVHLLGNAMRHVRQAQPFQTVACALLHDHLHAIWTLPQGDDDFSDRWRRIKTGFTQTWFASGGSEHHPTASQTAHGNRGVWQRRFWEHLVRDEDELFELCDYIHYNPVKHGLAMSPASWPHSTFHRFVAAGHYPPHWGRNATPPIPHFDFE